MLCLLARVTPGQPHFTGAKSCASCHAAEAAAHARTGHARALARLDAPFQGIQADWAFGAGNQAVTLVSRVDEDFYVEHGLSYYRSSGKFAVTPGHRDTAGERYRTFDPNAAILRCFQCHSTGPLRLEAGFRIEPSEVGVQCESCHGPGGDHKTIRNSGKLSGTELNNLCGACHRRDAAGTDWSDAWNVRHQPVYLSQSACFKKGTVTCMTCHVAHTDARRDACAGCHQQVKHRTALAGRSCVDCHMPTVAPNRELKFANHWIGIYAAGAPLRPIR